MKTTIPNTSETAYITGSTAFNIPDENGNFADWHFMETFLRGRHHFRIAGNDFVDTTPIFGSYGIRECSELLHRYGVDIPPEQKVYSANFIRALLDLVYKNILENQIPSHRVIGIYTTLNLQPKTINMMPKFKKLF